MNLAVKFFLFIRIVTVVNQSSVSRPRKRLYYDHEFDFVSSE